MYVVSSTTYQNRVHKCWGQVHIKIWYKVSDPTRSSSSLSVLATFYRRKAMSLLHPQPHNNNIHACLIASSLHNAMPEAVSPLESSPLSHSCLRRSICNCVLFSKSVNECFVGINAKRMLGTGKPQRIPRSVSRVCRDGLILSLSCPVLLAMPMAPHKLDIWTFQGPNSGLTPYHLMSFKTSDATLRCGRSYDLPIAVQNARDITAHPIPRLIARTRV
ncbi:hypothetical protein ACRALDRAFT_205942 [Sodiomyces alcalophilus JCM 7366]|uniref:uncharacterized protein n=1 Tax=Sodiomyces alcalophilus JCM 7366 TaxID=591952 RepID=UPI0039B6B08E